MVQRVSAEFQETPGLCIGLAQANCLFGVREDICGRVLERLVVEGTLERTEDGLYRRRGLLP